MLRGAEGHYWLVIKMTHNKLNIEINNILPVFGVELLLGEADQEPRQSPLDPLATGHPAIITLFSPKQDHKKLAKFKHITEIISEINKGISNKSTKRSEQ